MASITLADFLRSAWPKVYQTGRTVVVRAHHLAASTGRHFLRWAREQRAYRSRQQPHHANSSPVRARSTKAVTARVARLAVLVLTGVLGITAAGAVAMLWALSGIDPVRQISPTPAVVVEAADGTPLGRVGRLANSVSRQDLPELLVQAVLSIEDRRFYSHWGIDLKGIARAMLANASAGEVIEGGSTITQQLAKLSYVGTERSFHRKAKEALIAVWMDARYTKDEILTRYLNEVYLGSGAYGVSAAAKLYFDKGLSDLTLSEAALLAGLIQAPSRYDPTRNLQLAQSRAGVVLDAMRDAGYIPAHQAENAKGRPATTKPARAVMPASSWFADWIAKIEAPRLFGSSKESLRLKTTLDPKIQAIAERAIEDVLARKGPTSDASEAALVALRSDGAVVAMVGGRSYGDSQFNRAVDAQRQPGSAFKLFVYLAALRNGLSPDDVVDASPVRHGTWSPENSGGRNYTSMTARSAFAQSVNTAAVRLGLSAGVPNVIAAARELGLDTPLPAVPSIMLGSAETNLLDLTAAYASVAAGRKRLEPWGITGFGHLSKPMRPIGSPNGTAQVLANQQDLLQLLRAVVEGGTGRAAALAGRSAAGKTGTSQDHRDAWFIGFSDDLIAGVWVGNDDGSPMRGVTGGSLPAEIWRRFMTESGPALATTSASSREVAAREWPDVSPGVGESRADVRGAQAPQEAQSCDFAACAEAFNSFRASDCTYQPYRGARRRCDLNSTTGRSFERFGYNRFREEALRWRPPFPPWWE
ncbi:MAG TPA: PBP1A family penicillin-binding protein [Hyphomicrobiaceae bacterium]|nr:PBP1A family penicillin-binding protein [Hyphomicrobiaceae bacterium]